MKPETVRRLKEWLAACNSNRVFLLIEVFADLSGNKQWHVWGTAQSGSSRTEAYGRTLEAAMRRFLKAAEAPK